MCFGQPHREGNTPLLGFLANSVATNNQSGLRPCCNEGGTNCNKATHTHTHSKSYHKTDTGTNMAEESRLRQSANDGDGAEQMQAQQQVEQLKCSECTEKATRTTIKATDATTTNATNPAIKQEYCRKANKNR